MKIHLVSTLALATLSCIPYINGMETTPSITKVINNTKDSVYILPSINRFPMGYGPQKFQPVKLDAWEMPADLFAGKAEHDVNIPLTPPAGIPSKYSSNWGLDVIAGTVITSFGADKLLKRGKNLTLTIAADGKASISGAK